MGLRLGITLGTLGMALSVLSSGLQAQRPYAWVMPSAQQEETSPERPFSILLDHSEELALSASQIGRIESTRDRLVAENEPLLAQLRDAEVYEPQGEDGLRAVEAMRERLTRNARSAETQVRTILGRAVTEQALALIGHYTWAYPPRDEQAQAAEESRQRPTTTLVVENHNFQDATIYIVAGPRRQRLGFVGGLKDVTFRIPETFVAAPSAIRLEVRQIPARTLPLTDEVTVVPGTLVYLRIPPS